MIGLLTCTAACTFVVVLMVLRVADVDLYPFGVEA